MEVQLFPCNEIVGFDKHNHVIMAVSYWDTTHTFEFEHETIIEAKKPATNPPIITKVKREIQIKDFHSVMEHPAIVPLRYLPVGVKGATVMAQLIGISDA